MPTPRAVTLAADCNVKSTQPLIIVLVGHMRVIETSCTVHKPCMWVVENMGIIARLC